MDFVSNDLLTYTLPQIRLLHILHDLPLFRTITFSEINYQSSDSADAGDWVEFHNPDSVDIDLSGWKFRDNDDLHTFTFPLGTVIEANSHLVLAEDLAKFDAIYEPDQIHDHHGHGDENHSHRTTTRHESFELNDNSNVIGPLSFAFSNSGELLRLYDYRDSLHVSMTFSKLPPWPILPAGQCYTLESINNNPDLDNGDNWFAGLHRRFTGNVLYPGNSKHFGRFGGDYL